MDDTDEEFQERAAIMEFDGGLSRADAEIEARASLRKKNDEIAEDRILSVALHLAHMPTKAERDTETARIKAKIKQPGVADKIIDLAKELYQKRHG